MYMKHYITLTHYNGHRKGRTQERYIFKLKP